MIALAGVLSVMLLASCTKEVEIEGDADVTDVSSQTYNYRLKVSGTVKYPVYDEEKGEWVQKTVTLKSDDSSCGGWIGWNKNSNDHRNYKSYWFNVWGGGLSLNNVIGNRKWNWNGEGDKFDSPEIINYDGAYYLREKKDDCKLEISNPDSESFTVKGTWKGSVNDGESYYPNVPGKTIEFDLTFTR